MLDFLADAGFTLFETDYAFQGTPTEAARDDFKVFAAENVASTGAQRWHAFRRSPWGDYATEFARCQEELGLSHTDLVCVHEDRLDEFMDVLTQADTNLSMAVAR